LAAQKRLPCIDSCSSTSDGGCQSVTHFCCLRVNSNAAAAQVLYPAICLKNAEMLLNFGETPFKFGPPPGYVGLAQASADVTVSAAAAAAAATAAAAAAGGGGGNERRPLCLVLEPSRCVCVCGVVVVVGQGRVLLCLALSVCVMKCVCANHLHHCRRLAQGLG
jgi:hypothetical protein